MFQGCRNLSPRSPWTSAFGLWTLDLGLWTSGAAYTSEYPNPILSGGTPVTQWWSLKQKATSTSLSSHFSTN